MNVASALSSGYLRPSIPKVSPLKEQVPQAADNSLARQQEQILTQERALKTKSGSGAQVSTTYTYTMGADGRRYISSAQVTIKGDADAVNAVSGGVTREELSAPQAADKESSASTNASADNAHGLSDEVEAAVRELKQTEREVVAHEAAHKAAGGKFAGAISYTYTQGPDGQSYITGGSVPISIPSGGDPEQMLQDLNQVRQAALAPGNPSGQDMSVAAQASAAAAQARGELMTEQSDKSSSVNGSSFKDGIASVKAEMRFGSLQKREESLGRPIAVGEERPSDVPAAERGDALDAYALSLSKRGLWTPDRGFEADPNGWGAGDFGFMWRNESRVSSGLGWAA